MKKLQEILEKYGYIYEETDIWGEKYFKVYGDEYRDLTKFRHRLDSENIEYEVCNISSNHYWCVKGRMKERHEIMNRNELIHYICNKITTLDDEAHYVYNEKTEEIEKWIDGNLVDEVQIK